MIIDIITIFPDMISAVLGESILKIAHKQKHVEYNVHNLRDFTKDKYKKIDDTPYGGGPGMVIMVEPLYNAIEYVRSLRKNEPLKILTSPKGDVLKQARLNTLVQEDNILIVCGHYEGFDERIRDLYDFVEISIGDYVLTGGEIPALTIIDGIVRLLPGVLGDQESLTHESFSEGLTGKLDYPHYTRPREFESFKVPEVLLSGNHKKINEWRLKQSQILTENKRKDLLKEEKENETYS